MAKVLIIEDDENNRLLLTTLLEHAGHTALEANAGIPGAQLAAQEMPDLVIVDLSLPDISGVEVIKNLRSDPRTANAILALYTATQITSALRQLIEDYDIRGVIPKPGDPRQILEVFASILGPVGGSC